MEDVRELSASSCNGSQDTARESQGIPSASRLKRAMFSDTFTLQDMRTFKVKEEKARTEEGEKGSVGEKEEEEEEEEEESSPRGVLEDHSVSLDSETPSKASTSNSPEPEATFPRASTSGSGSEGHHHLLVPAQWRDLFRVFKKGPSKRIQVKSVPKLTRRKSRKIKEPIVPLITSTLDPELCYLKPSWKNFALSDIQAATNNFSHENLIGEGGYAEVYKGQLEDGQFVAIKRLTRGSPEEMTVDFLNELGIIVHVDHPNIAKLIGYGVEGGMHLVLQLSVNGSLASLLYGTKEKLNWELRYKIALGTAEGLLYLHEKCPRRIIHKDIKASNILLSEDFEAQISDFGLAKWLPEHWTHHTVSKVEGTFGYLPPEFFMHGIVDEKTDVFAYGVLLLELITGRQAIDSSQQSLVMWAKPFLMKNSLKDLVDPTLEDSYDPENMDCLVLTASMCIDNSSAQRPKMRQVVQMLTGDESLLEEAKKRQKPTHCSEELFDEDDEYDSTDYLNDLHRHMEVVLGQCDDDCEERNLTEHSDNPEQQIEVGLVHPES